MSDFLTIAELADGQLGQVLALARMAPDPAILRGRGVALIFERPSLRTRAAASAAVFELGGFATFFSDEEIGLDRRESAEDVARTLAETFPIVAGRLRSHHAFTRMSQATQGRLRMINLLSEAAHPTQAVADVLTLAEHFHCSGATSLEGRTIAYVGDVTNVTRSLAVIVRRLGGSVRIGAPQGYGLLAGGPEDPAAVSSGTLTLCETAREAVEGADVVYTDAWVSMGLEDETEQRRRDLREFRVDTTLLESAKAGAVVLHCLPAHRGDEVTDEVLDSARSLVWRQVYHRRTAMLGVLRWMVEEGA